MISDILFFLVSYRLEQDKEFKVLFDKGEPFLPLQQLMAVQPLSSSNLLPPSIQSVMKGLLLQLKSVE